MASQHWWLMRVVLPILQWPSTGRMSFKKNCVCMWCAYKHVCLHMGACVHRLHIHVAVRSHHQWFLSPSLLCTLRQALTWNRKSSLCLLHVGETSGIPTYLTFKSVLESTLRPLYWGSKCGTYHCWRVKAEVLVPPKKDLNVQKELTVPTAYVTTL